MQPPNRPSGNSRVDKGVGSGSPDKSNAAILNTLPASALLNMLILRALACARETVSALCQSYLGMAQTIAARVTWRFTSARAAQAMTLRRFERAIVAGLTNWSSDLSELSFGLRCGIFFASLLIAVPMAYLGYCIGTIPFAHGSVAQVAPSAKLFLAEDSRPFATRGVLKGQNISPDHIPALLANAVVAVEDRRFFEHGGIDPKAITRAAWHDVAGNSIQGGSTITQQLARRLYLSSERTVKRKIQEAMLAEWLELRLSKKEILARYLNTTYFGAGAYGANSAALRYFDKTAEQLSLSEAAMLAGLIKAPSELAPDRNLAGAQQRAGLVLDAMVDSGSITAQQAETARQEPAVVHATSSPAGVNYFLDAAAAEIKSQAGIGTEDLTVQSCPPCDVNELPNAFWLKRFI
jgi:penicillin-binding protein 1A